METIPILGISVWLVAKICVLLGLVIYLIFALVIIRQTGLMTDTVDVGFEAPIKFIAWAHFLFAIGIFILALMIL
jgi:hypothetical protein